MPTTTRADRSPRRIFVSEHERRAAGSRPAPILSLHVTHTKVNKHTSVSMRLRFLKHLRREFEKAFAYLSELPMPATRGTLEAFFRQAASPAAGPSAGPPSAAGASQAAASTPPRKSAEAKAAARKTTLRQMGKMPAGSLVQLGDSPVH